MKIFIVCRYLGGGGAERVAVNLAHGLVSRGHEVFCISDLSSYRAYNVDERIHLMKLHDPNVSKALVVCQSIRNIRCFSRKYRPDLIIGFMHFCSLVSRFAVIGLKINVIQTIHHALESDTYKFSPLTVWLDRHTCPLYTKTILLTQADKKVLHKWKHKIHVVPNPVTFTPLEKLPIKDNIILAAGRLDDWKYKGWDILINAAHTIAETLREKKWVIKIAGNGSTESLDLLKNMCQEKDVSDIVQFIGYQNDMQSLYKKASIFLLSSRSEGLPMVLIEAMSQGCACVATDFKGRTREIITSDEEGLLAAPEDYKSLAHHIDFLINNENKRSLIQQNAIARSMYYRLDNILNKWEDILNTLYKSEN